MILACTALHRYHGNGMTWRLSQHAAGQRQPLSHPQRLSLYSLRHSPRPSHLGPQGRHDRANVHRETTRFQVIQGVLQGIWHHLKRVARMSLCWYPPQDLRFEWRYWADAGVLRGVLSRPHSLSQTAPSWRKLRNIKNEKSDTNLAHPENLEGNLAPCILS